MKLEDLADQYAMRFCEEYGLGVGSPAHRKLVDLLVKFGQRVPEVEESDEMHTLSDK